MKKAEYIWALIIVLAVLAVDMFSKHWVVENIPRMDQYALWYPYNGIGIFKNFFGTDFSIVHATNRGAAWSLFSDYQVWLLALRIFLVIGLGVYLFFFNKKKEWIIPLALIFAGALGNILDYFIYGHVIDMFLMTFFGWDYPIFNIADSAITIGIIWLIALIPNKEPKTT
jgi:signal peptidase II